jgi:hypothetical protein
MLRGAAAGYPGAMAGPVPEEGGPISPAVLSERLGAASFGAGRDLRAAAELAAGEALLAVLVAVWRRRGWVVVATDAGLRLVRRPRLFGRAGTAVFDWRDLTSVSAGPARVALDFAGSELHLMGAAPHGEFVRLIEAARARLGGEEKASVEEIRELAVRKLGRLVASSFEGAIDGLPDRLQAGERVERLAGASLDFAGLLVLTDRRLLLLDATLRRAKERLWAVDRGDIRAAVVVEDGLRLDLPEGEATLRSFLPAERRDEFAVVLGAR